MDEHDLCKTCVHNAAQAVKHAQLTEHFASLIISCCNKTSNPKHEAKQHKTQTTKTNAKQLVYFSGGSERKRFKGYASKTAIVEHLQKEFPNSNIVFILTKPKTKSIDIIVVPDSVKAASDSALNFLKTNGEVVQLKTFIEKIAASQK